MCKYCGTKDRLLVSEHLTKVLGYFIYQDGFGAGGDSSPHLNSAAQALPAKKGAGSHSHRTLLSIGVSVFTDLPSPSRVCVGMRRAVVCVVACCPVALNSGIGTVFGYVNNYQKRDLKLPVDSIILLSCREYSISMRKSFTIFECVGCHFSVVPQVKLAPMLFVNFSHSIKKWVFNGSH